VTATDLRRTKRVIPFPLLAESTPEQDRRQCADIGHSCKPFGVDAKLAENFQWVFLDLGPRAQCAEPYFQNPEIAVLYRQAV
jgi:hypothetical protein